MEVVKRKNRGRRLVRGRRTTSTTSNINNNVNNSSISSRPDRFDNDVKIIMGSGPTTGTGYYAHGYTSGGCGYAYHYIKAHTPAVIYQVTIMVPRCGVMVVVVATCAAQAISFDETSGRLGPMLER
jgi:hypothetical protein